MLAQISDYLFLVMELIGTVAFAISGAMVAIDHGSDIFGVLFLGTTTALGGGVVRDLLVGRTPPAMFASKLYVSLALATALLVFTVACIFGKPPEHHRARLNNINNIFDAIGLGIFAVSGAKVAVLFGHGDNMLLLVFLGMTTAVGGGVLRDLFIREIPFVLTKHVYAVAAISGALAYGLLIRAGVHDPVAMLAGAIVTIVLRIAATIRKWNLPRAW